ncbi:MAG: hypothetical protein COA86_05385 [Kangiella sp.]|nr:MAG: hypothetical protein COA86_05385 [Kangiella sp.]
MLKDYRNYLVVIIVLALSACTSVKTNKLTLDEASNLKGKTVAYTKYIKPPSFVALTAANVQFGLIGHATAVSSGNSMIRNNNIEDPAEHIAKSLANTLSEKHNVKVVLTDKTIGKKKKMKKMKNIISLYSDYDYILDVRTKSWGSVYYLSDWNNYIVMYDVHARLIEQKSKNVIFEHYCSNKPEFENPDDAPTYKELEQGVRLKEELQKSVSFCIEEIKKETNLLVDEKTAITNSEK